MFKPTQEPAKTLYEALVAEQLNRKGRSVAQWIEAERMVVFAKATELAQSSGQRPPTIEQIIVAENSACGHTDYAAKFAYSLAEILRTNN